LATHLRATHNFDDVEFQGDNTAAVGYWSGESRFRGLRVQRILEEARHDMLYRLGRHQWHYLPREGNATADYLAGLASQLVLDLRLAEASEEELAALMDRPLEAALAVPRMTPSKDHESRSIVLASLADADSPTLFLPEKPDGDQWRHLALLRKADSGKGRALAQLFSAAVVRAGEMGFLTQYQAVPPCRFGRMYSATPSGSKLSKVAGLILYGDTHGELDMVGAHMGIFCGLVRQFLWAGADPPAPFSNVEAARAFLTDRLGATRLAAEWPTFAKHLWPIALNSRNAVAHVLGIVMRANVVVPEGLRDALVLLESLKARLSNCPDIIQPPAAHPRVAPHNKFYFIMEGYEARFMLVFLREMISSFFPESVVFRCDGFYCSPPCSPDLASHCAQVAARHVGIPDLKVKWTLLREAKAQALAQLYQQAVPGHVPSFFGQFAQREWWESLHIPKPQISAGPAEQRRRAHESVTVQDEEAGTLLRFIKRRRLQARDSSP
jgi:hypothetical protein